MVYFAIASLLAGRFSLGSVYLVIWVHLVELGVVHFVVVMVVDKWGENVVHLFSGDVYG